jgi:GTP-binding protein
MKILSAEFITCSTNPESLVLERLPQVAFVGRSNVGKSSLINSLTGKKGIAKISRTPGKTRTLNFFRIETADRVARHLYFVDLPGYGYAAVSESIRIQWGPLIERFVESSEALVGIVQLIDARRVEQIDEMTMAWLRELAVPVIVVVTKFDKLKRSERAGQLRTIRQTLDLPDDQRVIGHSSVTHEGRDEVWSAIRTLVAPAPAKT